MRMPTKLIVCLLCLAGVFPGLVSASDLSETERLVLRAEAMLWFGLTENGRISEFSSGLETLDRTDQVLAAEDLASGKRESLTRQIGDLREELTMQLERSRRRFHGAYPLVRLTVPFLIVGDREDITETTRISAANEAVLGAAERVETDIIRFQYPQVVFRSEPRNRAFENEALRVFAMANRPYARSRSEVVAALSGEELASFDRGEIDQDLVNRLVSGLGAARLVVLTIREDIDLPDGTLVVLEGTFFELGSEEPVDSFAHMGFSRDRRSQLRPMVWIHLTLLALAVVLAVSTPWSHVQPWPVLQRAAVGAALFLVGRIYASLIVMVLRRIIPDPDATAVGAAWWPGLLALLLIIGSGLLAWVVQARVSKIVPGSRSSRAVGMIFAMAALGACAYFIRPLLMLDPENGVAVFVPLVLAGTLLAGLTGYSVRTGPPVPTWFIAGPIVAAPAVGLTLFSMSLGGLWISAAVSGGLCAAAWGRHRYAKAHGLEEAMLDEQEAVRHDDEMLEQIGKKLEKKLPI